MDKENESKSLYFLKTRNENLNSRTKRPEPRKYDTKNDDIGNDLINYISLNSVHANRCGLRCYHPCLS